MTDWKVSNCSMKCNPINFVKKAKRLSTKIPEFVTKVSTLERMLDEERSKRFELEQQVRSHEGRIHHLEFRQVFDRDSCIRPEDYPQELSAWYYRRTGQRLCLTPPRTYNEKIQWFKLNCITPEISKLSDKIGVREYVAFRIGEIHLIPLLGIWNYPEEIDFTNLPGRFVVKANHGSGYNYIVRDKVSLDISDIINRANHWLNEDFAFLNGFELQYHNIPRRLLVEEYLENSGGNLYDYKFRCFNGKVKMISFGSGRKSGLYMDFYDRGWNYLPIQYGNYPNHEKRIPKPDNLEELISIAEKLADGFPQVRVDLYRMNDGRIYFGEMTFTPSSGVAKWDLPELDLQLGQLFSYPGMPE